MKLLSEREVSELLSRLSAEQREFIIRNSKQRKKDKWLQTLALYKGLDINPDMTTEEAESYIDNWVLVDILDSGYGNKHYRCQCGTPLRYQYNIMNKKENTIVGFGETCLANHTSLSSEIVKDIIKGFHSIDHERDEILLKFARNDFFNIEKYLHLDGISPVTINQVNIGLPLLDKQIEQLENLKQLEDKRKKREVLIKTLSPDAKRVFESLNSRIQNELIRKMENDDYVRSVPKGFSDPETEHLISLGLPILDSQQERIYAHNRKLAEEERLKRSLEFERYYAPLREQNIKKLKSHSEDIYQYSARINYEILMERHKETLKAIHTNRERLSPGNKDVWNKIIKNINQMKQNPDEFEYSNFKLNVTMICYQLNIDRDSFLYS